MQQSNKSPTATLHRPHRRPTEEVSDRESQPSSRVSPIQTSISGSGSLVVAIVESSEDGKQASLDKPDPTIDVPIGQERLYLHSIQLFVKLLWLRFSFEHSRPLWASQESRIGCGRSGMRFE